MVAAAYGGGSGSAIDMSTAPVLDSSISTPATKATYRTLLMRGLQPDEAANLTAFMCGIHVGEQRWTLPQVNQLLFLRELRRVGRFGKADGEPAPY